MPPGPWARRLLRAAALDVIEAFFPNRCRMCRTVLAPGPVRGPLPRGTRRCAALWNGTLGRPVLGPWTVPSCFTCPQCAAAIRFAPGVRPLAAGRPWNCLSVFAPAPALFDLVHAMKYEGHAQLADWFGAFVARAVRRAGLLPVVWLPVPLHPRREAERGFNPSLLVARAAARRTGTWCAERVLVRVRATPPQARLPHAAREANVRGAFARAGRAPAENRIAILDDVVTTGATAAACAEALGVPPERVVIVALCQARAAGAPAGGA